jgi:hypothetical protein
MPESFFAIRSQMPNDLSWFSSSHALKASFVANARMGDGFGRTDFAGDFFREPDLAGDRFDLVLFRAAILRVGIVEPLLHVHAGSMIHPLKGKKFVDRRYRFWIIARDQHLAASG